MEDIKRNSERRHALKVVPLRKSISLCVNCYQSMYETSEFIKCVNCNSTLCHVCKNYNCSVCHKSPIEVIVKNSYFKLFKCLRKNN